MVTWHITATLAISVEDEGPSKLPLPTFLEERGTTPYRQFHLSHWSFTRPPPATNNSSGDWTAIQGQQNQFWKLVGAHLTLLKLSNCTFEDASVFRKVIFQTCPNLQTLILYKCSSVEEPPATVTQYEAPAYGEQLNLKSLSVSRDRNQWFPISYLELLSHFPSLTSLNLVYDQMLSYNCSEVREIISWINAIELVRRHDGEKLPLGNFSVGPGFEIGYLMDPVKCREMGSLFQEQNLHAELLDVKLEFDVVDVLKDVLTLSGKTIRKIRAVKDARAEGFWRHRPTPSSAGFPCEFPFGVELDNLQELTLSPDFCRDMEFMRWTPNLEKLRIIKNDRDWGHHGGPPDQMVLNSSEAIMGDVKLLKLKELWMGYRLHDVEEARRFCGWMPNLEIATLFLDDEQFGVMCESWRNLKHLHVFGFRLGDKGITGMGLKGDGGRSGMAVVRPNITCLKELTCFQFAILDSKLSDSSIYDGFLKLPNLQVLEIASHRSTIGDEAMRAIHERVPNCQIIGRPEMCGGSRGGPQIRERHIKCRYFP